MEPTRRGLILGAGVAAAAVHLVKAEASDLLSIPRNIGAAKSWAKGQFSEYPGVRVVYSDGDTTKWHYYPGLRREPRAVHYVDGTAVTHGKPATYMVAIEVCVTDADGRRAINTVPVDGVGVHSMQKEARSLLVHKQVQKHRPDSGKLDWNAIRRMFADAQ